MLMTTKRSQGSKKRKAVDMSLPPEFRGRKPKLRTVGKGASAQMSHASGKKKQRQGEKRMHKDRFGGRSR
jgi:hypothetical protein